MSFIQVGGHPNSIQSTEDDSMILKPALPLEMDFYTIMTQARAGATLNEEGERVEGRLLNENAIKTIRNLKKLSKFVPKCYGTLRLVGDAPADQPEPKPLLVLTNLGHAFSKPNIIDIKLGTILYDELDPKCTPEKKRRREETARNTTSGECGMRFTGFNIHPHHSSASLEPVATSKIYGKFLKKEQLPEGIRRTFPSLGDKVECEASASQAQPSRTDLGLPASLLLPILRGVHASVMRLRVILAEIEMRVISGSLLVIWEGDEEAAREDVRWMEERLDDRNGSDDSESEDEEEDSENEDSDSEDEDENDMESSGSSKPRLPYRISLIDFAHTRFFPGQGPDRGLLLGLETFAGLVEGRINEVENSMNGKT